MFLTFSHLSLIQIISSYLLNVLNKIPCFDNLFHLHPTKKFSTSMVDNLIKKYICTCLGRPSSLLYMYAYMYMDWKRDIVIKRTLETFNNVGFRSLDYVVSF